MREIKFRAWDKENKKIIDWYGIKMTPFPLLIRQCELMQYTGLKDKNGLTDIYEDDILDENGLIKGNIHESPQVYKKGIDCVIAKMGTSAWRGTESIAMGRGCKYSE